MPNAPPKNDGTISGRNVSIQPRLRNTKYCGMRRTCPGTKRVIRIRANQMSRPGNRKRARLNAPSEHELRLIREELDPAGVYTK